MASLSASQSSSTPEDAALEARWLGRLEYEKALEIQSALVEKRQAGRIGDTLLFLEHEPIYTIGRTRDRSSLKESTSLPHPIVEINRGGQATFHGPGQLVGYQILDLHHYGCDLHRYLRCLEEAIIRYLRAEGIPRADRREGMTGVWVEDRKIASIGVGVRRWVTMHGFALNIGADLSGFDAIVPCGIDGVEMTSLETESGTPRSVEEAATRITIHLKEAIRDLRKEA